MLGQNIDHEYAEELYKEIFKEAIDEIKLNPLLTIDEALAPSLNNYCIYVNDSKDIVNNLDYDVFSEHEVFGLAKSWEQAAYNALSNLCYDYFDITEDYKKYKKHEG